MRWYITGDTDFGEFGHRVDQGVEIVGCVQGSQFQECHT